MKKRLRMMCMLMALAVGVVYGQNAVTVSTAAEATSNIVAGVTDVTVTGTWTSTDIGTLKTALKEAKATLETVDMSGATLSGDMGTSFLSIFQRFTLLTEVTLPSSGSSNAISFFYAFQGCTVLTAINNLDKFTNISDLSMAFWDCKALESITFAEAENRNEISFPSAFFGCEKLETITNLDKFTNISSLEGTFNGCKELISVTLPEGTSATSISFVYAFQGCTKLETINNLDKFTNFSEPESGNAGGLYAAFRNCKALTSITFSTTTNNTPISFTNAFSGCEKLTTINNLDKFTNISEPSNGMGADKGLTGTFQGCKALTSVTLSSVPTTIDDAFTDANPNMLKYINIAEFTNPGAWTNVLLPTGTDDSWVIATDTDLKLDDTTPFHAPQDFTIAAGKTITYTLDITGCKTTKAEGITTIRWTTICLPFDAVIPHPDKQGEEVYLSAFDSEQGTGNYWLRSYRGSDEPGVVTFADATAIEANTPYIISFPGEGWGNDAIAADEITFVATPDGIAATPTGGIAAGTDNYLFRTDFTPMTDEETDELYVLDTENNVFTKSSGLPLTTFGVYFADVTAGGGDTRSLSIGGGGGGGTITSIEPGTPEKGMKVYSNAHGALCIESDAAKQVALYSINGTAVRTVILKEGTNHITGLQPGMYIVERQKAVVF